MAEQVGEMKERVLRFARQLIESKAVRSDTLYIFSFYRGGDTLKLAAYSHHLKSFYPQDRIAIVCLQANSPVKDMFAHIDEVIPLDPKEKDILEMASQEHSDMYGPNWILGSTKNMLLSHFPGPEGVYGTDLKKTFPNACECYKSMILQIPYFYPAADVSEGFFGKWDEAAKEKYEKAVLLAPHSYSLPSPEEDFWECLCSILKDDGLEVYTNAEGDESEIPGSRKWCGDLRDVFCASRYFRAVISARSGLSDYLAFQPKARHIVLSPEENIMNFNDITAYGKSNLITNINWHMDNAFSRKELFEEIREAVWRS